MRSRAHTTKMQIAHTINYRRVVTASSWCWPLLSYGMSVLLFCVSWCILNRYAICIKMFKYDNEIKCIRSRSPFGLLTGHTENETTAEANTLTHTHTQIGYGWVEWRAPNRCAIEFLTSCQPIELFYWSCIQLLNSLLMRCVLEICK